MNTVPRNPSIWGHGGLPHFCLQRHSTSLCRCATADSTTLCMNTQIVPNSVQSQTALHWTTLALCISIPLMYLQSKLLCLGFQGWKVNGHADGYYQFSLQKEYTNLHSHQQYEGKACFPTISPTERVVIFSHVWYVRNNIQCCFNLNLCNYERIWNFSLFEGHFNLFFIVYVFFRLSYLAF